MCESKKKIFILSLLIIFSFSAFAFNKKQNEQDSIFAIKLQKEGIAAGRLGDFELALNKFTQVYRLREKMFGPLSYRLAPPLINMGIQYKNLGNFDKAVEAYKKAEALCVNNKGSDDFVLGTAYVNLGNIYSLNGDYNQALEYQRNAYRILKKDSIKYKLNFQDSKFNVAESQFKLGYNDLVISFVKSNLSVSSLELKPKLYDLIALAYKNSSKMELADKNYVFAINSLITLYGVKCDCIAVIA